MTKHLLAALALGCVALVALSAEAASPSKDLRIYNWNHYIGATTLADFTKATGIKVVYDEYATNEEMEAKINTGHSGYDIVVPTAIPYFARMAQAGLFRPLDKSKIPNLANLDPALRDAVQNADPGNKFGVIYAWGTTGIGYNVEKIRQRKGPATPSWDMVFNPDIVKKFADCGVTVLNSGSEIIPLTLHYLGLDPQSQKSEDLQAAENALMRIKPYLRKFDSVDYITDLAEGRICLAIGWSGDILQAKTEGAKKGVAVAYGLPREGTRMWFDMMGVLRDAPHPEAAMQFINFVLDPAHMAGITNTVAYANAVPASWPTIDPAIRNDPDVFPSDTVRRKLFSLNQPSPAYEALRMRAWERITGKK